MIYESLNNNNDKNQFNLENEIMDCNIFPSSASVSVWPSSKNLANDLGIPIVVEYRPFEDNAQLMDLSERCSSFPKCSYCSAYVTSVFIFSKDKISQCPYCGNDFLLPKSFSFLPYQNFKTEEKIDSFSFYLCFIIDLDCSQEDLEKTKNNFSIALKALLPGTFFMVAFIKNNRFHFIMMFNNNPKIISFNATSSLFEKITLKSFIYDIKLVDSIDKYVQSNLSPNISQLHEIVDFSPLFSECPEDIFIKFVMFSPNHVTEKCSSCLSFDWISPIYNSNAKNIDGYYLNPKEISNLEFQIQSLVQRYRTSPFAINLSSQIFYSKQFEISPSANLKKSSVHCGSSFLFSISFSRLFSATKEVHLQFVSKYKIISPYESNSTIDNNSDYNCEMKVTSRLQVNSYIFQTSKDVLPILRTVNPVVLKKYFSSTTKEKNFISKMLEIYKEKVTDVLPGSSLSNSMNFYDTYFLILPNLQLFVKFYLYNNKLANATCIVEKDLEYVQFCPSVSFWSTQDEKIEEMPITIIESDEAFNSYTPIAVIDSGIKIDIFMEDTLQKTSRLSKEIEKRIQLRFPVPTVQKHAKEALILTVNELNDKLSKSIKVNFDPYFKSQ